jgi:hypothetical protein
MSYLLAVPLEGSEPLVMEITGEGLNGVMPSAQPGEIVATANQSLNSALQRLQPMIQAIAQATFAKLRDLAECLDDFAVEFGIKMAVDAGLVVAHTSGEANFKVTLQWRRPRTP